MSQKDVVKKVHFTMDGENLSDIAQSFKCSAEHNLVDASAGSASDRQERGTVKFSGSVSVMHRKDGSDMTFFRAAMFKGGEVTFVFRKDDSSAASPDNLEHTLAGYLPKWEFGGDRNQTRNVTYDLTVNGYTTNDGTTTTDMATGLAV